jgi:catechol 2,3-dioxygenase-like lactoylglutathione lyase family enzyme
VGIAAAYSADQMFTGVNHVCVVTANVDRAVHTYSDRYGIGPWSVYNYDRSNMAVKIRGEPVDFKMRVGLCRLGETFSIELIQPLDDSNLYAESLAVHGGADHVHHLKLDVADFARASERLDGLGLQQLLDGRFRGADDGSGAHGVYYATEDEIGFVVEIGELSPNFAMAEPEYVYPAQ